MGSHVLSPSPSSCVAAAFVAPGQQGAVSRACRDPTKPDHGKAWRGNAGNAGAHGSGSPHGLGS